MKLSISDRFKSNIGFKFLQFINNFAIALTILMTTALVVYFIWMIDRGFENTDESYYLLLAMHSSDVMFFVSAQHWVTSALWSITGSLTGFRGIGFGILLFTAFLLARGIIHAFTNDSVNVKFNRKEQVLIIASTLSGAMLYGATINFSPCYNLLASAASYAAVGLVLLTVGKSTKWHVLTLNILSGFAIGIAILNKATAGMAILCLIIIFIAWMGGTFKKKTIAIIQIIFSTIAFVLLVALPHVLHTNVFDEIKLGLSIFKQIQVEPNTDRILRYIDEFSTQLFQSGVIFAIPLFFLSNYSKSSKIRIYTFLALLFVILFAYAYFPSHFHIYRWQGIIGLICSSLSLSLILTVPIWTKNAKTLILIIGLIIMPYCVAFGTGNPIQTQIVVSLASWGTIVAILGVASKFKGILKSISIIASTLFVFVITIQVFWSSNNPYHLGASIWKQNEPIKIGEIGTVKVDKATSEYILNLNNAVQNCKIESNRPYLGFYHMPGVALVINGIPVYSPWMSEYAQSELMLSKVDTCLLNSAVIGVRLNSDGTIPKLPKYFSNFPKGYEKCGEATYPQGPQGSQQIQIWIHER